MRTFVVDIQSPHIPLQGLLGRGGLEVLQRLLLPFRRQIHRIQVRLTTDGDHWLPDGILCSMHVRRMNRPEIHVERRHRSSWEALLGAGREAQRRLQEESCPGVPSTPQHSRRKP